MQCDYKIGDIISTRNKLYIYPYNGLKLKGIVIEIDVQYDVKEDNFCGKRLKICEKSLIKKFKPSNALQNIASNELDKSLIYNKFKIGESVIVNDPKSVLYKRDVIVRDIEIILYVDICGQNKILKLFPSSVCTYSPDKQTKIKKE